MEISDVCGNDFIEGSVHISAAKKRNSPCAIVITACPSSSRIDRLELPLDNPDGSTESPERLPRSPFRNMEAPRQFCKSFVDCCRVLPKRFVGVFKSCRSREYRQSLA